MKRGIIGSFPILLTMGLSQLMALVLSILHFKSVFLLYEAILILFPWALVLLLFRKKATIFQRRFGRDPIEKGYELPFLFLICVAVLITIAIGAFDFFGSRSYYLGKWCSLIGMPVFASGAIFAFQALGAYAPHHEEAYGETPEEDAEQGAYAQLRHPVSASAALMLLGAALILSSWAALIGWAATFALLVAYVSQEDRWRFNHYAWYYDYTQIVPRKMIPFIW